MLVLQHSDHKEITMEKIVYKNETGIAVITPAHSIDEAMKDIPKGVEYKIIDESELPQDRTFRNAWNYDLKEDIPKAKEIWKEKLRRDREPLFIANDLKIRDANIDKDTTILIEAIAERDRLRDITLLVDKAKTISAIKKVSV